MRAMLALTLMMGLGGAAMAATLPPAGDKVQAALPMNVCAVGTFNGRYVVLLEDASGKLRLPIGIGALEANAIDMRLNHVKFPRPLTHDLLETVVARLGARIERIEVVDLRDEVYFGRLTLRDANGKSLVIDARPSDLTSLALGAGLPIYVAREVVAKAALDAAMLPTP